MTGEHRKRHTMRAHQPEAVSDWMNPLILGTMSACSKNIVMVNYTGMDKTCLYTSSGSLFVILSGCQNVHITSNVIIGNHCSA